MNCCKYVVLEGKGRDGDIGEREEGREGRLEEGSQPDQNVTHETLIHQ